VSQIQMHPPHQALTIISLELLLTRIIFFHAHIQVIYCNCVKFHQYPLKRRGAYKTIWTDGRMNGQQADSYSSNILCLWEI